MRLGARPGRRAEEAVLLLLATIDLTQADLDAFDAYERAVLGLLPRHGGRLVWRLRALDGRSETHLLHFPDEAALEAFRADPARLARAGEWAGCGARATVQPVERLAPTPAELWEQVANKP